MNKCEYFVLDTFQQATKYDQGLLRASLINAVVDYFVKCSHQRF